MSAPRAIEGEQRLVRVFTGAAARWKRRPLAAALVERLRAEGFAGVTVLHGVSGFGRRGELHTADIELTSYDLPVVLEIVETPERVARLQAILDELLHDGFATLERVRVLRYLPRAKAGAR